MNSEIPEWAVDIIARLERIERAVGAAPPWATELLLRFDRLEKLITGQATTEVLTASEAARYVKRPNEKAFYRFRARTGLKPYAKGRYTRRACDVALAREQRGYRKTTGY